MKRQLEKQKQQIEAEVQTLRIPSKLTLISNSQEYVDPNNYRLIFGAYRHSSCELRNFSDFSPLLKKFDFITRMNQANFKNRDTLSNSPQYRDLYNGLSDDITLEELALGNSGRIIFFRVGNYFCIRAVLMAHR